jgi:hypothetical protein
MKTNFMKKGIALSLIMLTFVVSTAFNTTERKHKTNLSHHFIIVCEKGNTLYLSQVIDKDADLYSSCKDKSMVAFQDYIKNKYNVSGRIYVANYTDLKTNQDKRDCLNKFKNVQSITYIETDFTHNCK